MIRAPCEARNLVKCMIRAPWEAENLVKCVVRAVWVVNPLATVVIFDLLLGRDVGARAGTGGMFRARTE